jgi:hypothetical protein
VDKVALGQVFSEYFGFPCQSLFHQLLQKSTSSIIWGLYNRPEVAAVPSGLSPTPPIIKKVYSSRADHPVLPTVYKVHISRLIVLGNRPEGLIRKVEQQQQELYLFKFYFMYVFLYKHSTRRCKRECYTTHSVLSNPVTLWRVCTKNSANINSGIQNAT